MNDAGLSSAIFIVCLVSKGAVSVVFTEETRGIGEAISIILEPEGAIIEGTAFSQLMVEKSAEILVRLSRHVTAPVISVDGIRG